MGLLVGITGKGILVKERKERKQKIGERNEKKEKQRASAPKPLNPKCVVKISIYFCLILLNSVFLFIF